MTKQDYEALAQLIKVHRNSGRDCQHEVAKEHLDELARDMAQYMANQNKNFDQVKFLDAAGVQ